LFDQNDDDTTRKEDRLAQGYDTILKESALLTTFAGILFGFLLEISINTPKDFAFVSFFYRHSSLTLCNACNLSPYTIPIQRPRQIQDTKS
jgi:hypothetical protein